LNSAVFGNNLYRFFVVVFLMSGPAICGVLAAEVDSVLRAGADKITDAQGSQRRVDKVAEQTSDILREFRMVSKQIESLKVYNAQLGKQIANQQRTMTDITDSIDKATVVERQILPLSIRMLDVLGQYVNLDLPFNREQRQAGIARVRANLVSTQFSAAEKFRQVLELYSIEAEYGNTIDQYSGLLSIDDQERQVIFLRVGRIVLAYQTTDQNQTGVWDIHAKKWQPLKAGEYRTAIAKGIRIAKKQAAIDVLSLPIAYPVIVQ
jgi:hypothetical protein